MDRSHSRLFGSIRALDKGSALDTINRIGAFVRTRTHAGFAAEATALIWNPALDDVAVLKGMIKLMNNSAGMATTATAAATAVSPLSLRMRPATSFLAQPTSSPLAQPAKGRETSRLKDVQHELSYIKKFALTKKLFSYLDIGCSEGHITAAMVEAIGIPQERAHACDVVPQQPQAAFTFTLSNNTDLPYESSSFDFITMFMSAHHFAEAGTMFRETRRVARPGSILLIREHDCTSESMHIFLDIVHALYSCVFGTEQTPEEFVALYAAGGYTHYRRKEDWVQLLDENGFELLPGSPIHGPLIGSKYGNDRFNSFYALFRVK